MKKSLAHLPQDKADEVELIAFNIRALCEDVQMVILFGSYARGTWKDGPHEQGRGRLIIHKRSDYDILVLVEHEYTARDIDFVNDKLQEGQYFFTEIVSDGIIIYDSGRFKLARRKKLKPAEEKQIAQGTLDEVFKKAKGFYRQFMHAMNDHDYKIAAFELHQAVEHSYKTVLLIFGGECPQEHHLDILGDLAADYCPELAGILPRETDEEKELFELLDYAYIGARYDREYKITKQQLEKLSKYISKLHAVTEKNCVAKINSFI